MKDHRCGGIKALKNQILHFHNLVSFCRFFSLTARHYHNWITLHRLSSLMEVWCSRNFIIYTQHSLEMCQTSCFYCDCFLLAFCTNAFQSNTTAINYTKKLCFNPSVACRDYFLRKKNITDVIYFVDLLLLTSDSREAIEKNK